MRLALAHTRSYRWLDSEKAARTVSSQIKLANVSQEEGGCAGWLVEPEGDGACCAEVSVCGRGYAVSPSSYPISAFLCISALREVERVEVTDIAQFYNDCMDMFCYFNSKNIDALVKCNKGSLDMLRRRDGISL